MNKCTCGTDCGQHEFGCEHSLTEKTMEQVRDELAREFYHSYSSQPRMEPQAIGWREKMFYTSGFDAATQYHDELLKPLIEAINSCLWIDKCKCDEAYTGRGRHEPNTYCDELDPLREALSDYHKKRGKE